MKRKYCAISKNGKFNVCTIGPCGDFHCLGDVRDFETFDEADTVARAMALGEYDSQPGEYINMR